MNRLLAMETFVSVVETGSFSAAAQALRTGQSSVSKTIAQLEARLGVRLLLRTTRSLTPTDAGKAYYGQARGVLDQADLTEREARGIAAALAGHLRIGASATFSRLHIMPRLKEFLALHPAITVELVLEDRYMDLIEGSIDVALRAGETGGTGVTAQHIGREARIVVASPAYFAIAGTPRHPRELARHETVTFAPDGTLREYLFRRGAEKTSVTLTGRLTVTSAEGVRAAVLEGLGIAIVSNCLFASELQRGAVRLALAGWDLPPIDLWAVYPAGRLANAKARAFVAFLRDGMPAAHRVGSSDVDAQAENGRREATAIAR